MTNEEVVVRFRDKRINRNTGTCEWQAGSVNCDEFKINSFGWWPMAYRIGEGFFLKNGDRYSPFTSRHQRYVQDHLRGPTIPFSILFGQAVRVSLREQGIGLSPRQFKPHHFIEVREDDGATFKKEGDGPWVCVTLNGSHFKRGDEYVNPGYGMFSAYPASPEAKTRHARWHLLGGVLFKIEGKSYLCGMDEGTYFVSQLRDHPKSIAEAYQSLKPQEVREAEEKGIKVLRQGEWFFVPTGMDDAALRSTLNDMPQSEMNKRTRQKALPGGDGNLHVCRQFQYTPRDPNLYAKGTVYHRDSFTKRASREHAALALGEEWHIPYINTQIAAWTAGGNVD